MTTPSTFDEQYLFFKMVSDDVPECQLGSNAFFIRALARLQVALDNFAFAVFVEIPYVVSFTPAIIAFEVRKLFLLGGKFEITVLFQFDSTMPLHVRLAGQNEDFDFWQVI